MITINYRDSRPIYEQIKEGLKKMIISGVIKPDSKLQSVRDMASEMAINPNTIQRAYRELEAEGYIYSVAGKGSFVSGECKEDLKRKNELVQSFVSIAHELLFMGTEREELIKMIDQAGKKEEKTND